MEHFAQSAGVINQHDNTGNDVHHSHEGHQLLRNTAQALHAAQDDDTHQDSQDNAQHQVQGLCSICAKAGVKCLHHVADGGGDVAPLGGVADAEGSQRTENTEDNTQPLPVFAQAVLDVIHGAADPVAILVALTVFDRQHNLGVLGHHADEGGNPQPEDGARAAQGDGGGDAGDVAGADGGGQRGSQSLEGSDLALLGLVLVKHFADGVFHGVAELPELEALQAHSEDNARAHEENQCGNAPHNAVQPTVAGSDCAIDIHTLSP